MKRRVTENTVKKAIIEFLQYSGWLVLRVNSGASVAEANSKRRFFRFVTWFIKGDEPQVAGVSDILAFHPDYPHPLAVETKSPGRPDNVSEAQRRFMAEWTAHGGIAIITNSLDVFIEELEQYVRPMA